MFRNSFIHVGLIAGAFVLATTLGGCGDEDSPIAPSAGPAPTDEITVTLRHIDVIQNCTTGALQYKFYVTTTVAGKDSTYLETDWNSIQSNDGDIWTNLTSTTFELPRRSDAKFKVRASIREWVGSTVAWSHGRFYEHLPYRSKEELWQPDFGGYSSYSAAQTMGTVSWDVTSTSTCRIELDYEVDIQPK
jgi:hypothetical protein